MTDILDRLAANQFYLGHSPSTRQVVRDAHAEIKRLTLENWQLKGALGYPVPGDIPEGPFKCGLCDARRRSDGNV